MDSCCSLCKEVLVTGIPHAELVLISEVTESKIFKCHRCKTFMHFSSGDWEIFIPSPLNKQWLNKEKDTGRTQANQEMDLTNQLAS